MRRSHQHETAVDFLRQLQHRDAVPDRLRTALTMAAEEYRWARRRPADRYDPPLSSADAAIYSSHERMHARIRDQVRNDSSLKGIRNTITDKVVGSGIRTFADPLELLIKLPAQAELIDSLETALEMDHVHREWWESTQVDIEGRLAGPDLERLGMHEQASVGDTLFLICQDNSPGRVVPFCLQAIERDQLDCSKDRPSDGSNNRIVNGIELDAHNRPVAYHLFDAHPGDSFVSFQAYGTSRPVPANRVIHAFMFSRPSQSVGVSWFDAIGQDCFDGDGLVSTELQSAKKAALLAFYVKRAQAASNNNLGLDDPYDVLDAYGNEQIKMGATTLAVELGLEDDLGVVETHRPNTDVPRFLNYIDQRKAAGTPLSYYSVTGDFVRTNYTGFKGALINEDAAILPLQSWYGRHISLPIRRRFNAQAIALGRVSRISPREYREQRKRFDYFDMIGPGRELLDPGREDDAITGQLRTGRTTLKIQCAKRGLHWIDVLRQLALESHVCQILGVTLDYSKGNGGQIAANSQAADATELLENILGAIA